MSRRPRRKKAVPMTWKQFTKRLLKLMFAAAWSALCLLGYLNPLHYIRKKFGYFNWVKNKNKPHIQRSWFETLKAYFKSEEASRRELLAWIQAQIPALQIEDLRVGWTDGIALCALVNSLCPGACPRYDLLKADQKLNNCRLALKLAQKHLGVSQDVVTAEEIADPVKQNPERFQQLLSLVYYMYGEKCAQPVCRSLYTGCTAMGSGLVTGVIGKKCNVKVIVPTKKEHILSLTISGPNQEFHMESIRPGHHGHGVKNTKGTTGRGAMLWKLGTAKVLKSHGSLSASTELKDIPFDCKETTEGNFDISYTPQSVGLYKVSIKWKDSHIKGSPFSVDILSTDKFQELKQKPLPIITTSCDSASTKCTSKPRKSLSSSHEFLKISNNNLMAEKDVTNPNAATAMAILRRSSTLHRSISKISGPENVKLGAVRRRKILKRIITKSGQEIIINAASMSSMSSQDDSDKAADKDDPDKDKMAQRVKKHIPNNPNLLKSFDFEGAYESDCSSNTSDLSFDMTDSRNNSAGAVAYIMDILLNSTFTKIKRNEQIAVLQTRKDLFKKGQEERNSNSSTSSSKYTSFGRGKRYFSTSALLVPAFQRQFHCSPFTDSEEVLGKPEPLDGCSQEEDTEREASQYRKKRQSRMSEPSLPSYDSIGGFSKDMSMHQQNSKPYLSRADSDTTADDTSDFHSSESKYSSKTDLSQQVDCAQVMRNNRLTLSEDNQRLDVTSSGSCDSSQKDAGSRTDGEAPGSGVVSVHTQMMDSNTLVTINNDHRSGLSSQEVPCASRDLSPTTQNTRTWWPSDRDRSRPASESEMSSFNYSRASSFNRSHSISLSSFSSISCSQDDDVFSGDPSALKLLTSDSMQKSCLYFANGNIKEDNTSHFKKVVSEDAVDGNASLDEQGHKVDGIMYKDRDEHHKTSLSRKSKKLHSSMSLPNLTMNWRALDDDSTEEVDQGYEVHVSGDLTKTSYNPNSRTGEHSATKKKTTSRRGSLARQQEINVSENTSGSEDPSEHDLTAASGEEVTGQKDGSVSATSEHPEKNSHITVSMQERDMATSNNQDHMPEDQQRSKDGKSPVEFMYNHESSPYTEVSPQEKQESSNACCHDKATQVTYGEIKSETGWVRPSTFLLRRRHPISVEDMRTIFQSLEIHKRSLSQTDKDDASLTLQGDASDRLGETTYLQPEKTFIVHNTKSLFYPHSGQLKKGLSDENTGDVFNKKPFTTPSTPVQKQKEYVNGHKKLTRNRYRGKMKLDPSLISQDPNAICDKDVIASQSLVKKCVSMWTHSACRTNNVVSEKCWRRWKKQLGCQSKHGIRKRVKFSNRVLMYRRSSSRSTKYSSQNSRESATDLDIGSAQNEDELTRIFQTFLPIQSDKGSSGCRNSVSDENSLADELAFTDSKPNNILLKKLEMTGNKSVLHSSLSSDGFGINNHQRQDLLNEVDRFRRLSLPSNNESLMVKAKSMDEDSIETELKQRAHYQCDEPTDDILAETAKTAQYQRDTDTGDKKHWHLDNHSYDDSSLLNQMTPLGEDYVSFTGLLDDAYQDACIAEKVNHFLDHNISSLSSDDQAFPVPAQCIAFGSGLRYGQVGVKNNFQVRSLSAGHGSLGVSINGPKPHTVVETNVTYTGDDLYEVIYEVKYPGFYVITVKWADINIPESPFICKVTF